MSQGFICCSFVRDRHILLLNWSYSKPGEVGLISRMFIKSKSAMRPVQILCIVGYNARLILECLASNVKRI